MAELRPYEPTWRDRIAQMMMGDGRASPERRRFVEGLLGSSGLGNTGMGVVDVTPVGGLLQAQEAVQEGDPRGAALAVVPPLAASKMKFPANAAKNEILQRAVPNTPAASFSDDALLMRVMRQQKPEQAGEASVRGGVFYLPEGSPYGRFYNSSGTAGGANYYGGTEKIAGETAFYNPLVVKGQTGGKAPEQAYIQLKGKDAFKELDRDVMHTLAGGYPKDIREELTTRFLEKHAPELSDQAWSILQNSNRGNQLRYALQEAAIGSAARDAGYDSIIGYSVKRDKNPFLTEVFDLREDTYPTIGGGYTVWPGLLDR